MREIVLDTETTGLSPSAGHRIIEIGCVELVHGIPTGKTFHCYVNPERDVPREAFQIHGLSQSFLSGFTTFPHVYQEFLLFIDKSPLVIHNAKFDMNFLNSELSSIPHPPLENPIIDTLHLAKQKFPGSPASLDALCKRFQISLEERSYHGALLDARLLARVYLELASQSVLTLIPAVSSKTKHQRSNRAPRVFHLAPSEEERHEAMLEHLNRKPH